MRLTEILFDSDDEVGYAAFIIMMLKECDDDINKILRILNTGVNGISRGIPVTIYNYLITAIKEAIIIDNYERFIEPDGFISILAMSKLQRFKLAYIDRQTIIRTFNKYGIEYNRRK